MRTAKGKNKKNDIFKKKIEDFSAIRISIASPEEILAWSYGEVKKPETINYRSYKCERDGLYCEVIFGPEKDWSCACGKYKGQRHQGVICDKCGVQVTLSKVRRERMGHIKLAAPVAHIWYVKNGYIANMLEISNRELEQVLHYAKYIVIDPGNLELRKKQLLEEEEYRRLLEEHGEVFKAGMGAEAIKELLSEIDIDRSIMELRMGIKENVNGTNIERLKKRLKIFEAFKRTGAKPEWMILEVLPVLPPELRPILQLEDGRMASSDLTDLYRRLINRNNRLKKLQNMNAPELMIKNEKRMLQEAVDALIDNSRINKPIRGNSNRNLKSLTDLLQGKQGRFRRNLLGKRVDYSGRSVIVIGPKLKIWQCGLPKKMALELFKPFLIHKLIESGLAASMKKAKDMIEKGDTNVIEILSKIVKKHPVLLNRAPTLHRPSIQAFEPVLIDGKAIQIPALVCAAFNADFDGDQMAVHVPLLYEAQAEARLLMQANYNIFSPAHGKPLAYPTQDMTLGCYYLTRMVNYAKSYEINVKDINTELPVKFISAQTVKVDKKIIVEVEDEITSEIKEELLNNGVEKIKVYKFNMFANKEEAILAYENKKIKLEEQIWVKLETNEGEQWFLTCVGRIFFNEILPESLQFINEQIKKGDLTKLVSSCYEKEGLNRTVKLLDDMKELGFKWAAKSGASFVIDDLKVPETKTKIIKEAEEKSKRTREQYEKGEITAAERRQNDVDTWMQVTEKVTDEMLQRFKQDEERGKFNSIYAMANSGARGNVQQVRQLAGMRGLMSNPKGEIMDYPIKSNFKEGLTMFEYFISTYGARKGLVDTALRTADSGDLTRKLVDVAQDVVVVVDDCGTTEGYEVHPLREERTVKNPKADDILIELEDRIRGRFLAKDVLHPRTGEVLIKAGTLIGEKEIAIIKEAEDELEVSEELLGKLTAAHVTNQDGEIIIAADKEINDIALSRLKQEKVKKVRVRPRVYIRSPLTCKLRNGICRKCYGLDLSTQRVVSLGETVGIIAAQSIGEPGTQLTMRTFHTGGVAVAKRSKIVAKVSGTLDLRHLKWEYKTAKVDLTAAGDSFDIEDGVTKQDDQGFEQDTQKIVREGYIVIKTKSGKLEKYDIPSGATLARNLKDGMFIKSGAELAEYNPNQIVSRTSGKVYFAGMEYGNGISEGVVATKYGRIIVKGEKTEEYHIPKGYYLRVEEGTEIKPGTLLAEKIGEKEPAINNRAGITYFHNINQHTGRVINDEGILYIFEEEVPGITSKVEYDLPSGVREERRIDALDNYELAVKNGSVVEYDSEILIVKAGIDGTIESISNKQIVVRNVQDKEHLLPKYMKLETMEENGKKYVRILSNNSGNVKIIKLNTKPSSNTSESKRIVVSESEEFHVPYEVKLLEKELRKKSGQKVKKGDALTSDIRIVSEIDGEVEVVNVEVDYDPYMYGGEDSDLTGSEKIETKKVIVRSIKRESINTNKNIGKELIGKKVFEPVKTVDGKVLLKKGDKITDEFIKNNFVPITNTGILYKVEEQPVNLLKEDIRDYIGSIIKEDVIEPATGEILAQAGDIIDEDLIDNLTSDQVNVTQIMIKGQGVAVISEEEIDLIELRNDREQAVEILLGKKIAEDIKDEKTGEIIFKKDELITGEVLDELLNKATEIKVVKVLFKSNYKIPEGAVLKFEEGKLVKAGTEIVKPLHIDGQIVYVDEEVEYVIPPTLKGIDKEVVLRVKTGDKVQRGDDLIEPLPPYRASMDGIFNYKTKLDELTKDEIITVLQVYNTQEYTIPNAIDLVVSEGDYVNAGDPLTDKIVYEEIEEIGNVYKIKKKEELVEKYKLTKDMEVKVTEGDRVKRGDILAILKNNKMEPILENIEEGKLDKGNCFVCYYEDLIPASIKVWINGKEKKVEYRFSELKEGLKPEKLINKKVLSVVYDKTTGEVILDADEVIGKELAKKIVENIDNLNIDNSFIFREKEFDVDYFYGVIKFLEEKAGTDVKVSYKYKNKMVVILNKRGNTINKVILRRGEAFPITEGAELKVQDNQEVEKGVVLAKWMILASRTTDIVQGLPRAKELFQVQTPKNKGVMAPVSGIIRRTGGASSLMIEDEDGTPTPIRAELSVLNSAIVFDGEVIEVGDPLTEGSLDLKELISIAGIEKVRRYLNDEIQRVYKTQGVTINDKHIEVILSKMFKKVKIKEVGSTRFIEGEEVTINEFMEENNYVKKQGKQPARGEIILQGIVKAALTTDSFISAASFQETTRVLTAAAVEGKIDYLKGLKENIILGRKIPAGTALIDFRHVHWPEDGKKEEEEKQESEEKAAL